MSLSQKAYTELKNSITSLRIRPGERLDVESISASMGFSRAPVVEALNMLRTDGLVVSRRRVGTYASEIDCEQIEEVFGAREMIEQSAVPLIVYNVSDRQIEELSEIMREANSLLDCSQEKFDYVRFMKLDAYLHSEIIRLSECKIYRKWFEELAAHMQRVRHLFDGNALERSREGQIEHENILTALRKRDVDGLRAELLNHTRRSRIGSAKILDKQ